MILIHHCCQCGRAQWTDGSRYSPSGWKCGVTGDVSGDGSAIDDCEHLQLDVCDCQITNLDGLCVECGREVAD
jgi:hypothetical protein